MGKEVMQDVQQVKALLARFGLSPNRGLGQNFLVDGDKAAAIAEAACPDGSPVLEIGPGLGALTKPLLERAQRVCAVEIDPALCQALQALFGQDPRFTLLQGDFLKADLEAIQTILGSPFSVAANLPYYVTTPICLRLLSWGLPIPRMALMAQAECADRFFAQPGSRQYGPLAVLAQYYYQPRALFSLSPADYYPQPGVDSQVVVLESRRLPFLPHFAGFLQQAFAMRRKTLRNNLKGYSSLDEALTSLDISPGCRAEALSPQKLASLCIALLP